MKLSEMPKEELELMGYDDIAGYVLQESGKKMKLADIFKKVCKVLDLPSEYVDEHLMDFFELMSINKKFVMLKNGYWDLQSRHEVDFVLDENEDVIDDEVLDEEIEEEEIEEDNDDDDIFYEENDETDDPVDDDLADFTVVEDEEE